MSPFIVFTLDEWYIARIAADHGCKAEVVRDGNRLVSDEELGTRMIVSGGEVRELPMQKTNNKDLPF